MNSEEFSCIKQVVKTVQLALPFMYVSNHIAGINAVLDGWKRQFVKQLNGIVVSYKNVSLTSRVASVSTLMPYAVYNVKATFDLFCPNIGDIVKGKINRISKEHIGCLIQGTINVTIHLPRDYPAELSKYIYLDREILFEIADFVSEPKVVRVTGNITPKCIELMNNLFSTVEDSVVGKGTSSSDDETTQVNLSILNSIKASKLNEDVKNKKVKKRKRESESSVVESSEESSKMKTPRENNKPSKKKKSKNLDSSITLCNEKLSNQSNSNLDSIPTDFPEKSPKKKKSKTNIDSNLIDSSDKSPKKKKSKIEQDSNLTDSSDKSPKKKKLKHNLDSTEKSPKKKKSKINIDTTLMDSILMSPKKELERKNSTETNTINPTAVDTGAFNNIDILKAIKQEIGSSPYSSTSSTVLEVNKKKRKRETLSSGNVEDPGKKKKHKKKNKDGLKSAKSKDKKKLSKKQAKVAASGTILKKDKKSSKAKKPSKKEKSDDKSKTSKKKSKKGHKKDKSEKRKNKKIKLDTNFETIDVKKIKSET